MFFYKNYVSFFKKQCFLTYFHVLLYSFKQVIHKMGWKIFQAKNLFFEKNCRYIFIEASIYGEKNLQRMIF